MAIHPWNWMQPTVRRKVPTGGAGLSGGAVGSQTGRTGDEGQGVTSRNQEAGSL